MNRGPATWSLGQWALRSVAAATMVLALVLTGSVGVWPAWWLVLAVATLAVAHALAPEASFGAVGMFLVIAWWGIGLRDGPHPQALLASAALLSSHLAGLVAAYGPERMTVDRETVLLWLRRGVAVFLLAPTVWLVATGVRDQPEPDGVWVAGLVAAVAALAAAAVAYRTGTVEE